MVSSELAPPRPSPIPGEEAAPGWFPHAWDASSARPRQVGVKLAATRIGAGHSFCPPQAHDCMHCSTGPCPFLFPPWRPAVGAFSSGAALRLHRLAPAARFQTAASRAVSCPCIRGLLPAPPRATQRTDHRCIRREATLCHPHRPDGGRAATEQGGRKGVDSRSSLLPARRMVAAHGFASPTAGRAGIAWRPRKL